MSGGHFSYDQYRISRISDEIEQLILLNGDDSKNEWGETKGYHFSPEIIARFSEALRALRVAYIYARHIDWLLSGDDGEESFLRRLNEELDKLDNPA